MMKRYFLPMLLTLLASAASATDEDANAVYAVLERYATAWHAGDAQGMAAVTHPELLRRKAALLGTDGAIRIETLSQPEWLTAPRSGIGARANAQDKQLRTLRVFDTHSVSALALLETGATFSYLQLVRERGQWRVLSVLWEPKATPEDGPDASEAPAVEAAAREYIEAWYAGDAPRMEQVLHPELAKRKPALLNRQGDLRIDELDAPAMIAFTASGHGRSTPEDQRLRNIQVLDVRSHSAIARVETGGFYDYLALIKDRSRWRIVNILWEPNLD